MGIGARFYRWCNPLEMRRAVAPDERRASRRAARFKAKPDLPREILGS